MQEHCVTWKHGSVEFIEKAETSQNACPEFDILILGTVLSKEPTEFAKKLWW